MSSVLSQPLPFTRGPTWPNRLALAPMINQQSLPDGRLGDDEYRWLTMRAQGGFGMTMTCAAYVQPGGIGFLQQLGIFGDEHVEGLARLAAGIKAAGSVAQLQLYHAGVRAPTGLAAERVSPSDDADTGARALTEAEVGRLRDDFIAGAIRADVAGFDGVELHGAHGYLLGRFLSPDSNRRQDAYGGALENRSRLIFELIAGIRAACRPDFQIGLRLSPERFGMRTAEIRELAGELLLNDDLDYLDMSLWDVFKAPEDETSAALLQWDMLQRRDGQDEAGPTLLDLFASLPRRSVRLGVAGHLRSAEAAIRAIEGGADFALIGRAAILHHDFARRAMADPTYRAPTLPVSVDHLAGEGVSSSFVGYLRGFDGFIAA